MTLNRREAIATVTGAALTGGMSLGFSTKATARQAVDPAQPFLKLPVGGTVLFQGDSITDGGRWREGRDFNHIMGQDYGYIIAGCCGAEFPKWNLDFVNRGIGGNTLTDLKARWQTDTLDLKPDLLSLLVGINDAAGVVDGSRNALSSDQYANDYDVLIQQTLAALPSVRLVLCQPFVFPTGQAAANYPQWRSEVDKRGAAVAALAARYHATLVPYQKMFDDACKLAAADHWSWDGIHPTYAGHYLMAQTWMRIVQEH